MSLAKSKFFRKIAEDSPITVVDVGARGGVSDKWRAVEKYLKVIGFEADEAECDRLNKKAKQNQRYLPFVLTDTEGHVPFYSTRNPACGSVLQPNIQFLKRFNSLDDFEITGEGRSKGNTLDNVVRDYGLDTIDFLKLDTQGSELSILKGARHSLEHLGIFGVEIEVEFSSLYRDQQLFADVDTLMRDNGYALFDITLPLGRKVRNTIPPKKSGNVPGQALWTDALYFRDFIAGPGSIPEGFSREKAIKTLVLTEMFGFTDYAFELSVFYREQGIISEEDDIRSRKYLNETINRHFFPERILWYTIKNTGLHYLKNRFPAIYRIVIAAATGIKK